MTAVSCSAVVTLAMHAFAGYLNDSSLALTVFAPTNAAWLLRLPTLTTANEITVEQLFSQSKSAAVQNMLQYHILNTPQKVLAIVFSCFNSTRVP